MMLILRVEQQQKNFSTTPKKATAEIKVHTSIERNQD